MIKIYKCLLLIVIGILSCITCSRAYARDLGVSYRTDSLIVYFRQSVSTFDVDYKENGKRCKEFIERIKKVDSSQRDSIGKVCIYASASPEGSVKYNEKLANERANSAISYIRKDLNFADSVVFIQILNEDWQGLASKVEADDSLSLKEQALAIINDSSDLMRKSKLQQLDGGRVWNELLNRYFEELRSFKIFVYFYPVEQQIIPEVIDEISEEPAPEPVTELPVICEEQPVALISPQWHPELTLKTNVFGWAMLGSNIAVEYDIIPHLSVVLPFHYSGGLDYFKPTVKFRGIVLQPGIRYYPFLKEAHNDGFYVGAHFGLGWYNYALDGEFRIQDYKGRRPAYGGGIDLGYALQFKKNPRWGMEFGVGAGVYDAKYDIFYNENNGPYAETGVKKVYFGIDGVSLSFTYKFGLSRKGGN